MMVRAIRADAVRTHPLAARVIAIVSVDERTRLTNQVDSQPPQPPSLRNPEPEFFAPIARYCHSCRSKQAQARLRYP
jgi:hypothetical protein